MQNVLGTVERRLLCYWNQRGTFPGYPGIEINNKKLLKTLLNFWLAFQLISFSRRKNMDTMTVTTKSYIDLWTSWIHWIMIRSTGSFNYKSMHLLILAISLIAVGLVEPYQAFSSSNNSSDGDNSGSSGKSREDLINQLCQSVSDNPTQAELAASALGFPGDPGAAANALCSLGWEKWPIGNNDQIIKNHTEFFRSNHSSRIIIYSIHWK